MMNDKIIVRHTLYIANVPNQFREVTKMSRNYEFLKRCCDTIEANCESDFEEYSVGYYLSYEDGKIMFSRVTSYPNGEYYSDGGIDTNSSKYVIWEEEATLEDYTNIAIHLLNMERECLAYEYGGNVFKIQLRSVLE